MRAVSGSSATGGALIHASIGIATGHGPQRDYESLLRAAGHAMYAQKKT